jgi:ABC-type glycerol-3-phosphate transport system substrate-binding protein
MRASSNRWFRSIVAVTGLLMVTTVACVNAGSGDEDPTQAPASVVPTVAQEPTEPTTISFSSWVGESPQMKKLAQQFNEEYPNITVEFENVPAGRSRDKLLTQVAGGNPPDVAYMDAGGVQDFASRGALVNLDGYVAGSDVVAEDDYVEGFRLSASFDDSLFGLPYDGETTGLFYRTDLFEAAGLDSPPATWEEFEAAAEALTDPATKQYGVAIFATEAAYYWYPWLWQAGGDTLSEDGQTVAFDDENGQQAADFYVNLAQNYAPPDYLAANSWDGRVAFATGKVGMYIAGNWFAGTLISEFPDLEGKWASAPLPEGDAGCATTLAGDTLVMFDGSQNQDAAWLWMEFLSRPENMAAWTFADETTTLLPPRKSLLESEQFSKSKPFLQGFAQDMGCAVVSTVEQPKWPEVETALNEQLGAAMYGDVAVDEALTAAATEGQEILDS